MAEVLGTAAAAIQLATYCGSLLNALQTIRYASRTIRRYRQELKELERICYSIHANSLLRTEEIAIQINSIISSVVDYIDNKLGKSRGLHWVRYLLGHAEFAEFFKTLEAKKSSLALSICNVSASAIYDIRTDVRYIRGISNHWSEAEIIDLKKNPTPVSDHPKPSVPMLITCAYPTRGYEHCTDRLDEMSRSMSDSGYQSDGSQHTMQDTSTRPEEAKPVAKAVYTGQTHAGSGDMLNGPEVNERPDESLVKITEHLEWNENTKKSNKDKEKGVGSPVHSQTNGPHFTDGKLAQPYAGT